MRPTKFLLAFLLASSVLAGCSLAPTYKKPDMAVPEKFKEGSATMGKWQLVSKNAGTPDQMAWWTIFNDVKLNQLEQLAMKENNSLKSASARLDQARALLRQTTGSFYPRIDLSGNASRSDFGRAVSPTSNFAVGAVASYDANMFAQIKDLATSSKANTRAAESIYQQALLMVQADVASAYYSILALDTERDLLHKTIDLRVESQKLIEKRFKEGEAGEQDFLRAKAETSSTQSELNLLDQRRALLEHSLAILTGANPSVFALEDQKLPNVLPRIPAGLPSSLLERRPDVAAAEQRMIQTNAQIGIARAAYFPNVSLTAYGGLMAPDLGDLFSWSSHAWAFGPLFGNSMSFPLFDGGRRSAGVDLAKGRYTEAVGDYRQQVLVAFKDVEDNLASIRLQADQAKNLYDAAEAATKASRISDLRYKEGETSYLEVLDTQRDTLAVQRAYTQVQGARFNSTVNLIRSLGGGWVSLASVPETEAVSAPQPPKETAPIAAAPKEIVPDAPKQKASAAHEKEVKPAPPVAVKEKPVTPSSEMKPAALPPGGQAPAPLTPQSNIKHIEPSILFD